MILKKRSILPGFGLSMGFTLLYLSVIMLLPLAALVARGFDGGLDVFWKAVTAPDPFPVVLPDRRPAGASAY